MIHQKFPHTATPYLHHGENFNIMLELFLYVFRQNPRNYTNVINNGVSRSENLQGYMSFDEHYTYEMSNMLLPDALIEEVQRIAGEREDMLGLEECYKKVCKVRYRCNISLVL